MKFCFKLQKSAKETREILKLVYGDAAVTMKTVYKWFERFRKGCEPVEDEKRSGRPLTSKTQENVERVSEMIPSNRRLSIREISEELNISYGSVQKILKKRCAWNTTWEMGKRFHPPSCKRSISLLVRNFLSNKYTRWFKYDRDWFFL